MGIKHQHANCTLELVMYYRLAFQHYFCKIKLGYNYFKAMNFHGLCYSFREFEVNSKEEDNKVLKFMTYKISFRIKNSNGEVQFKIFQKFSDQASNKTTYSVQCIIKTLTKEDKMRNAKEKGTLSLWEIVTATDGITSFIVITNRLIKRTKIRLLTFTCIQKLLQIGIHEWHFTLIKKQ